MNIKDESDAINELGQLPITAELPGFRPDEMAVCPACGRKNAPDRPRCMYCAAELGVSPGVNLKVTDRLPEEWENCFNLVITAFPADSPQRANDGDFTISSVLQFARPDLVPIPVRRTETRAEAEHLLEKLENVGFAGKVVSDEAFALTSPPTRIRGLDFAGGEIRLITFNTGEVIKVAVTDMFVVVGTIETSRTEIIEKRKRGTAEVLDETADVSREAVIDIYPAGDANGYRILEHGFDFVCLGDDMEMVASKNIAKLKRRLIEMAGVDATDTGYDESRDILDLVWPPAIKRETLGMKRSGFARKDLGRSRTSSNLDQFTRYSRMRSNLR